ncbi:MAG: hypothetical protein LC114_21830 [Bryobacterales bacterium]|nr:hypothetical protein [Bryobacterales bacterium]
MTVTQQAQCAWTAWDRAVTKGYVSESIRRHVGEECFTLLVGGIAGVVLAVGSVMVASASGAAIGGALGGYFSAGNPAASFATAELGATIGRTIAETALLALGVYSVAVYMADHMWEIGRLAIAAYDIAVNQLPFLAGEAYDILLDLAARWFAEAVGVFCGFLVVAIATLVMARYLKSEKGQTRAQSVKDLFDSKLNQMCNGLVKWIVPRAEELRYKMQPAGKLKFAVINGGVGPEQASVITRVSRFTRSLMPKIVDQSSKMVRFGSFMELDSTLRSNGFRLTSVKEWGPPGGEQLFYERGNVCCRVKTKGDNSGKRERIPHISFGVNDGVGTAWYNDIAKVRYDGKLTAKLETPLAKYERFEKDGVTPQRYVSITGGRVPGNHELLQDAWAHDCHFNLSAHFNWAGLDATLRGVQRI